jgi:fucose permease
VGSLGFSVLPPAFAALLALPLLGMALSVFVPVLLYLTPRRIGTAAAPRAIGYQVAAAMIGGATLPAAVGLLMQSTDVAVLGPCLVAMAVVLGGLHVASTRTFGSRTYVRQLLR